MLHLPSLLRKAKPCTLHASFIAAPHVCILARAVAAVFKQAIKGCTLLTDCAQKAVVAYFVQQALQNTTNAFLAFVGNQTRDFPSYQDFAARQQLYTSTLQQVASANAGLKNFFLTVNEFADQTEAERNVVNGVKGLHKVGGWVGLRERPEHGTWFTTALRCSVWSSAELTPPAPLLCVS